MNIMPKATTFEQEIEKAMAETAAPTVDTSKATATLHRVSNDANKGFNDRRVELENEIAIRQEELADVKVAITAIEATIQSIEAGLSLKKNATIQRDATPGVKPLGVK